eukprot:1941482-Prymnesium_polylepis.1
MVEAAAAGLRVLRRGAGHRPDALGVSRARRFLLHWRHSLASQLQSSSLEEWCPFPIGPVAVCAPFGMRRRR